MASKITYQLQYYDTLLIFLNFFWFDCVQYLRTRTYCVCTFSYFSLFFDCCFWLHPVSPPWLWPWNPLKTSLSQIPVFPIAEWWYTRPYAWSTALAQTNKSGQISGFWPCRGNTSQLTRWTGAQTRTSHPVRGPIYKTSYDFSKINLR